MNKRLKKLYGVATAGLLHDIGKLYQRADKNSSEASVFLSSEARRLEDTACPPHSSGSGARTHKHALWTMSFWERHSTALPVPRGEPLGPEAMDCVENVSSYHHSPTSGHAWQELMQKADWCSSGMDRSKAEDENSEIEEGSKHPKRGNFRSTRLLARRDNCATEHEYNLGILKPDDESAYPIQASDPTSLTNQYKELAKELDQVMAKIKDVPDSHIELRYEALHSALENTTWCIPSSTIDLPDISLFDHSRGTAAIAAALADFAMSDDCEEIVREKFGETFCRFAVLDLAGIQNFIYDMVPTGFKGMAKVLRARSFYVTAMLEAVEIALLKELNLPRSQTLMNGGGKLVLLLPAREGIEDEIRTFQSRIEERLVTMTHGTLRIHFGLGDCFGMSEFLDVPMNLNVAYDSAMTNLAVNKLRPFAARIAQHDGARVDHFASGKEPCNACGKMMAVHTDDEFSYCEMCHRQKNVGKQLVNGPVVQFEDASESEEDFPGTGLKLVLKENVGGYNDKLRRVHRLWEPGATLGAVPLRYAAHYVPRKDDNSIKMFDDLADAGIFQEDTSNKSCGIRSLAALTADVDNLGTLFSNLLAREKGGLTSMISVSRQLNFFFGGMLESKLQGTDIYTVYAGGDDMFFIGTWNEILKAAEEWRGHFDKFTCGMQHFSAGISLAKPGVPVNRLHDEAEEQLKLAKKGEKNNISLWNTPVAWGDWEKVVAAKEKLVEWRSKEELSVGQVYRLLDYARRARKAELGSEKLVDDAMWLPHMRYDLGRNLKDKDDKKEVYESLLALTIDKQSFAKFYDIALSWALYETREAGEGTDQ